MNKKSSLIALTLIATLSTIQLSAQTKYWVKFKNKTGTPYSVSTPTAFLTAKSVQRRTTYNIPVDQTDLPVTPSYISQVDNVAGVTVLYASKWLNGVVIATTGTAGISAINSFSFVMSTGPVNRIKATIPTDEIMNQVSAQNKSVNTNTFNYGGSYWQNKQLGVDCIHNQGFRGQGMTIAVLDDGFNNVDINQVFDSLRNRNGILGTRDFVVGGTSVYEDDQHGAMVLSCMAAIKPNMIMGSAPRADYWLLRTEDVNSETPSEEYNWVRGAEFADSVGADILTTSLGYTAFDNTSQSHTYADLNGKTSPMSIAATMAARKGMFVLNAAGNDGGNAWGKIGIPADADSICTVGAIDSLSNVAGFSSVGPTADGRIKPDLVSRGLSSCIAAPNGSIQHGSGTSFATPILAGAVACFWQAHKTWNNMKILDTLRKTASNAANPDNQRGWGTPNMCAIPTGIKEQANNAFTFNFWPNPFNSEIVISTGFTTEKQLLAEFYNVTGTLVKTVSLAAGKQEYVLNLENVSAGIYFLKLSGSQGFAVKKIVKN
ncbi:MAG: S8 family serine peptidase [Bacteroidetes bacterium]|nr:S8 family serine peptidase [Bacteroidota bacterium]